MRNHVLRIYDKKGTSFRMKISTPTIKARTALNTLGKIKILKIDDATKYVVGDLYGDWKAAENGFLRFNSGKTRSRLSGNGDVTTRDLLVLGEVGVKAYDSADVFGMEFFQYEDYAGVNDEGEGFVIQPWVVNLTPGRVKWEVID